MSVSASGERHSSQHTRLRACSGARALDRASLRARFRASGRARRPPAAPQDPLGPSRAAARVRGLQRGGALGVARSLSRWASSS